MTEQQSQFAIVHNDFKFTDDELTELRDLKIGAFFSDDIAHFELIIGSYLGATEIFYRGGHPTDISPILRRTRTALSKASQALGKLTRKDEIDALIIDSIDGKTLAGLSDLTPDELVAMGLALEDPEDGDRQKQNLDLTAGDVLSFALGEATDGEIDLRFVQGIIKIALEGIEASLENIASTGGRIRDHDIDTLLLALTDRFHSATKKGPYSVEARDFIDFALLIISKRLVRRRIKLASQIIRGLNRNQLEDRLKEALWRRENEK